MMAGDRLYGKLLFTWLSLVMSMMGLFVLFFFPRGVLGEILNLIESVSEGFPSYFIKYDKCLSFLISRFYVCPLKLDKDKRRIIIQRIGKLFYTIVKQN